MKKCIVLVLSVFIFSMSAWSQSTNISTVFLGNIKKADHYFNHYAYRNALNLYLHVYDRDSTNLYVQDQIAECYFKLHNADSAALWYEKIIHQPGIHPENKFEYGETLSILGRYKESKYWFEQYQLEHPNSIMVKEKINFLDKQDLYAMDTLRFIVNNVSFNSTHSDYGAHFFHNGVVFASSRDSDYFIKHKPFDAVDRDESLLNMYYVSGKKQGEHGQVEHLHRQDIKSALHEGPMAFFKNDSRAAFTRSNIKNGKPEYDKNHKVHLQIYFADVATLSDMKNITPFEHNNIDYSVAHPSLTPDGKVMYFSSTAPGGFGGADIYYSINNNGRWEEPVNLGPNINTSGDESFPFIANDTTLYFSSNGHGSLGGLDILVSYKINGDYTKAYNFGGHLNSRFDDFSMILDSTGRAGYMASNRPGGMGVDDIYYFIATNYFLTGKVLAYDKTGAPVEGVAVYAVDPQTGNVVDASVTDNQGRYELSLPFDTNTKIVAYKEGYDMLNDQMVSTFLKPMGGDSLNLSIWKRDLFAKGTIYSNETQQPLAGVTVKVFDLTNNKVDSVVLGDQTRYSVIMRPDRNYRIEFTKPGFLKSELSLKTNGLIKGEVLNDIVMHEESIDNSNIYFDYDKSNIKEADITKLNKLVRTLKRNPKATLNIGAHADSRGSIAYNQRLSDDRARSTADYFVAQGISRKRITAKGFGETLLLNRCTDTVNCEEVEHSVNRRAEIKVQVKDEPKTNTGDKQKK
jgi:outer membrane protein OmpA-like peptidoglycan-associated protein